MPLVVVFVVTAVVAVIVGAVVAVIVVVVVVAEPAFALNFAPRLCRRYILLIGI